MQATPTSAAPRADVTAACCVAATMLATGEVPSAAAVAAAHDALADGWARRARRLPAPTAAETIRRLAPLRDRVRVADLVDAMRSEERVPPHAADGAGRSLHSFRHVSAVVDDLFRARGGGAGGAGQAQGPRALLWETRPAVLMAALPGGVWAAHTRASGMTFERVDTAADAVAFMRRFHTDDSAPAPCNFLELVARPPTAA